MNGSLFAAKEALDAGKAAAPEGSHGAQAAAAAMAECERRWAKVMFPEVDTTEDDIARAKAGGGQFLLDAAAGGRARRRDRGAGRG